MPEALQSLFLNCFFISLMLPNIIYDLAAKAAKHLFPLSTAVTNWIFKKIVLEMQQFSIMLILPW